MKEQLAEGNINIKASDPIGMQFSRALLSEGEPLPDGSRAIQGFTDDGNMTFVYVDKYGRAIKDKKGKEISIQQSNIKDLLVPKNPVARGSVNEVGNKAGQIITGKNGLAFDENAIVSMVEEQVLDLNTFKDLASYQGPNTGGSLADGLHGVTYGVNGEPIIGTTEMSTAIFGELNKLGDLKTWDVAGADGKKDGEITAADFTNPQNYKKLVDYILDGEDLNLSKKILQTHLVNEAKGYYDQGFAQFNATEAAKKEKLLRQNSPKITLKNGIEIDGYSSWGVWRKPQIVLDMAQKLMDPSKIENLEGWDGNVYTPQADGTWKDNDGVSRSLTWMYDRFSIPMDVRKPAKSKAAPILTTQQRAADEQTYLQNIAGYLNTKK